MVRPVFVDLIKAFGSVDHDLLCKKLEHYGVQQREPPWLQLCLANGQQFCRVDEVVSDIGEEDVGVPQGSCLGPLIFLSTSMISLVLSRVQLYPLMLMILAFL